jgi:hypothetical protein
MNTGLYDLRCLMCGTEAGQLVGPNFVAAPGAQPVLVRRGGLPRCAHCGGSLYLDPADAGMVRSPASRAAPKSPAPPSRPAEVV